MNPEIFLLLGALRLAVGVARLVGIGAMLVLFTCAATGFGSEMMRRAVSEIFP